MAKKITETGPQQLRGIRNPDLYPTTLNASPISLSDEEMQSINDLYAKSAYSNYDAAHGHMGYDALRDPITYEGVEREDLGNFGQSHYDENVLYGDVSSEDIQNIRYENQPWYDVLANGIGKMFGTAGTTLVSSLVGLPYGLYEAANQGRWSALWDNDVTEAMANVDDWMEKNMTNYQSQAQQQDPRFRLGDMNWWADNFIKNVGFTLGAAASMAVGSGSVGLLSRSLGFVNEVGKGTKMGTAALSALFAATGEGMIEARQGVDERNKLETQRLEDSLIPYYNALQMQEQEIDARYAATGDYDAYMKEMNDLMAQRQLLEERKQAGLQQIEESGLEMGNTILLANQGLLTAGNLIQFGKGIVKSFDKARHAAEVSSKAVKPSWVRAVRAKGENPLEGLYTVKGKKLGLARAAFKGLVVEGSEEMNQEWIQQSSGAAFNEQDVNDYWRARLDPDSYRDTTEGLYTLGQVLDRGFKNSWGDIDQWEQFLIGGLTGMGGTYMPTRLFNQDKTKSRLNPLRYGSWEGGAFREIPEFNRQYRQYTENIDEVNKILQSEDFPARMLDMVGHTYTEDEKQAAVEADNKKAWKDADDKQFVHDVQSFLRAGKLDDLRAIYDYIGKDMSDEDIDNLIKHTTKHITAAEDKQNHDAAMDELIAAAATPEEKARLEAEKAAYKEKNYDEGAFVDRDNNKIQTYDEIRKELKHNSKKLHQKLDSYLESIDYINRRTGGRLTKDQEDNLVYLHHLGKESDTRMREIMSNVRKSLPSKFLLKTNKTTEQLAEENVSSDLTFTKDENTKPGYVEVDTTLMNDSAFADFFQEEIMRGGNINPEFAETAEERAARGEEEKTLPEEERKRRARERASKRWKKGVEQAQEDAREQWNTNWQLLVDNFMDNYRKNGTQSMDETLEAFEKISQDLMDAAALYNQAGEYYKTLNDYMRNPSKVEEAKAKEEGKAVQAHKESQYRKTFVGKDAKQMKQDIADGNISAEDIAGLASADLSNVTDDGLKQAQEVAKKAQEGMQKAAALKNHIQENLGANPSQADLNNASIAMDMIDNANLSADDPSEINIENPALNTIPLDRVDINASIDDINNVTLDVQDMIAGALNAFQATEDAKDDIPDAPSNADVSRVETPTTGYDDTAATEPIVVAPKTKSPEEKKQPLPDSPLTEGALDNIITETSKTYEGSDNGTWRSTTGRYGKEPVNIGGRTYWRVTDKPYHELITDKNSILYKRSKAIWEYLNANHVFERQENSSEDRLKKGDTVHFMVKYLPEVFGKNSFDELTAEEKPYSMVILMLNDRGEVIGDLPLAQFEPSYRKGSPTQQVQDLLSFQKKVFDAFEDRFAGKNNSSGVTGNYEAVVDSMPKEGADNLNLTFDGTKTPLVSKVSQVMRGAVPYTREVNTLNDIAGDSSMALGVRVTGTDIATTIGDKNHSDIVVPNVGKLGNPYLLLPTASGEKMAVPFYMKAFDAQKHQSTEFYKQLCNAIYHLMRSSQMEERKKIEYFRKHWDVIKGLLQVERQEGISVISMDRNTVAMHLESLTDPEYKINIAVPNEGDAATVARALANQLSGIPINVSLQYTNRKLETGIEATERRTSDYNRLIGEIADANLPKNTQHTVNAWFTVELSPSEGIKKAPRIEPKRYGKFNEVIGGRNLEFDMDAHTIIDPQTEEYVDDEQAALLFAEKMVGQHSYKDKKNIQVSINGIIRVYNIESKKFIKGEEPALEVQGNGRKEDTAVVEEGEEVEGEKEKKDDVEKKEEKEGETEGRGMTIEEIEEEVKDEEIVNRKNKNAWDAIPKELKLRMVNDGNSLILSYNDKHVVISYSNINELSKALQAANMAAVSGTLSVSEAFMAMSQDMGASDRRREDERAARRWLSKNLPTLSSEERTQFVNKLAREGGNAGKMWGNYRAGVIQILNNAPMGAAYHEAFHYVADMLLSDSEKEDLFKAAREVYEVDDNWTAEERLAEDFRRYAINENATGIVGTIKRWIRKIMDRMKRMNKSSEATINQLFRKINNGEFATKAQQVESYAQNQQKILREIRNVQREKYLWRNLDEDVRNSFKEGGLTEETYSRLSLEEQQQYIRCGV